MSGQIDNDSSLTEERTVNLKVEDNETVKALTAKIAQLEALQTDMKLAAIGAQSKAECERLYRSGKITKAEFDRTFVALAIAALDDSGITAISTEAIAKALDLKADDAMLKLSRKDRMVQALDSRPSSRITLEMLAASETFDLPHQTSGKDDDFEAAIASRQKMLDVRNGALARR